MVAPHHLKTYTQPTSLPDSARGTFESRAVGTGLRVAPWRAAAALATTVEDWRRAQAFAERWIRLDPGSASAWRSLAVTVDRGGPWGATFEHPIGIVMGNQGDPDSAASAYRMAAELSPAPGSTPGERTLTEMTISNLDAGSDGDARNPSSDPGSTAAFARGWRALEAARRQGGFTASLYDELVSAWHMAVAPESGRRHERARFHLVRIATQHADWETAFAAAWPDQPLPPTLDAMIEAASAPDWRAPEDWWMVAGWRLTEAGLHVHADLARRRMADEILSSDPTVFRSGIPATLRAAQAAAALGNLSRARALVRRVGAHRMRPLDAATCSKLSADLALREGQIEPLRQWRIQWAATPSPHSESRFSALVSGQDIAIVGPAPSGESCGAEIDRHDTIIRTKWIDDMALDEKVMGSRTDIAYYSDSSAAVLEDRIASTVGQNDGLLTVLRPSAFDAGLASRLPTGAVRFTPGEDLGTFHSSHFALQRIVYDLLPYEPRSIKLYHANFFTRRDSYATGYQFDTETVYRQGGLMRVLPTYGHDVGADFRFAQTLFSHGLVDGDPTVRDLLNLSDTDYLALVDIGSSDRNTERGS